MATNSIHFNHSNRTIEISKCFSKAASFFGTDEFKELAEAMKFAPTYRVVVKKAKNADRMKGLTHDRMRAYIKQHDDESGTIMQEFDTLTEKTEFDNGASYGELKTWFLAKYPEIEETFRKKEAIITDAKVKRKKIREGLIARAEAKKEEINKVA